MNDLVESKFRLRLKTKKRKRRYIKARYLFIMLSKNKGFSNVEIANEINLNSSTIVHYLKHYKAEKKEILMLCSIE